MSAAPAERLVYMANQIAKFFESQPGVAGAAGVADHLQSYWDPVMRADLLAWVEGGGSGLDPLAVEAVVLLRASGRARIGAALAKAGQPTAQAPGDDAG